MDEYQELFNKITKEITSKRKEIPNLEEKLDKANERYNKLKEEITSIEYTLGEKTEELENMPNKNNNKIFHKIYIPGLLLILIPSFIMTFFTVRFIFELNKINSFIHILLGVLSGILGIILPTIPTSLILKKIFLKKLNQSKEKIKISPEYQNLLKEVKTLENNLSIKKKLQKEEEKIISDTKTEYNLTTAEINMKETLLKHLKNENYTKSHNITNEQEEIKPHKKTRKKD